MGEPAPVSATDAPARPFFAPVPLAAWIVALLAAVVHLFPVLHARASTPEGYEFTGNVTVSPDYMQYRTWMRQSQESGPFVDNRFTSEPSRPYLPVAFYWAVGQVASATGMSPEDVYSYAGSVFAFALALLVFLTVRRFLPGGKGTWWVFAAILAGGGLGAHLKVLHQVQAVRESGLVGRVVSAVNAAPVFESYRSHYFFKTLFDSHFLLLWLVTLAAILAFWSAVRAFTAWRATCTAALCALLTLLHVYEAFTLFAVFAGVVFFCWKKRLHVRPALVTACASVAAMSFTLGMLLAIYRGSGLPLPDWKPEDAPFMSLVLAFPVAWPLIVWGILPWWRSAGLDGCLLLGWGLGCALLSLSGPYYPYADRAPMTMQIPVMIVAGAAWFARRDRVGAPGALLLVALLGVAPAYEVRRLWRATAFDSAAPYMFLSEAHRATLDLLQQEAKRDDVLLAAVKDYRWLAPEFPGRSYHAHFFLTVDYDWKEREVVRFFAGTAEERAEFLRAEEIRFLYVSAAYEPASFESVAGLTLLQRASHGSLFAVGG